MKELVFNTQERAISSDLVRLQKFKARDLAELFRYALDAYGNDDLTAGNVTVPGGSENPGRAEILNGLLVRPQIGTQLCTVDPGVMYAMADDGVSDDSVYKYGRYDGDSQVLTIDTGAIGARIDVIECRVSPTAKTVSESRDIFNPSTGLFTASSVVKETSSFIEFRVRKGTAGVGFPGTVLGWIPLCVVLVPSSSTNTDTCTFWDVRPLISDRQFQPVALASQTNGNTLLCNLSGPNTAKFGNAEAVSNGRRLGGKIRRGSPGVDSDTIDLSAVENQDATYSGMSIPYLYLLTPFGLPRWARYTDASTGSRVPRSCRGIPLVSNVQPNQDGTPSASVIFPTAFGFAGAGTTGGRCISIGAVGGVFGQPRGRCIGAYDQGLATFSGTGNLTGLSFVVTPGVDLPRNVKRVRWLVKLVVNILQTGQHDFVTGGQWLHSAPGNPGTTPFFSWNLPVINFAALGTFTFYSEITTDIYGVDETAAAGVSPPVNTFLWNLSMARNGGGTQPTLNAAALIPLEYWT
jgi:hypothetical protein